MAIVLWQNQFYSIDPWPWQWTSLGPARTWNTKSALVKTRSLREEKNNLEPYQTAYIFVG